MAGIFKGIFAAVLLCSLVLVIESAKIQVNKKHVKKQVTEGPAPDMPDMSNPNVPEEPVQKPDTEPADPKPVIQVDPVPEEPDKPVIQVDPVPEEPKPVIHVDPVPEEPKPVIQVDPVPEEPKPVIHVDPVPEEPKPVIHVDPVPPSISGGYSTCELLSDDDEEILASVKGDIEEHANQKIDHLVGECVKTQVVAGFNYQFLVMYGKANDEAWVTVHKPFGRQPSLKKFEAVSE
jgi:hypothetical protein